MSDINVTPYLFFDGNCREAMEFYKSVFGGELNMLPVDVAADPRMKGMEGKIMNASLFGGDAHLLASDAPGASAMTKKAELCLQGSDEQRMREIFDKLSQGGGVRQPLEKMFWGDIFGSLTDKYGVDWMMDITTAQN